LFNGAALALTGASWQSAGTNSIVEYDLSATALSGGNILYQGYTPVTALASQPVTLQDGIFKFQLQRNGLTSTPLIFTLAATGAANGDDVLAAIEWEEV
jgi:hypothetical protein